MSASGAATRTGLGVASGCEREATLRAAAVGRTFESVALHALAWLVATSAVGLLMALLLLVPEAGAVLGPFTYGRWATVHLDLGLYGWCALPLVGMLFRLYRGPDDGAQISDLTLQFWSGSLLAGALLWLLGESSGKVFLEWAGAGRWLFLFSLLLLAAALLDGLLRGPRAAGRGHAAKLALLLVLSTVPVAMLLATARHTYPPINPASGGPTGADLLGSTLGVLWIFLLTPALFELPRRRARPALRPLVVLLAAQFALFAVARAAGETSHRDSLQLSALVSLLVWAWPLPRFLYAFEWPAAARPWLAAFLLWAAALLASGLLAFLPGVLERVKFTNALVGHAHVAMAGMASSFGALVLLMLNRGNRLADVLAAPRPFAWWQAACVLHVAAVVAVGGLEARDPGVLFRPDAAVAVLYAVRALAGVLMLGAAASWLRCALEEAP